MEKELLDAIRTQLRDDADLGYIRNRDVYITPHVGYVLASGLPCIGIKDGKVTRRDLTGGVVEKTMLVHLVAMVSLLREDAAIMGDSVNKGVLDLARDIEASLKNNLLGLPSIQSALPGDEGESEMFLDEEDQGRQRKIIIFTYVWEE